MTTSSDINRSTLIQSLLLKKHAFVLLAFSVISGLLSGGCMAALVALIHYSIRTELANYNGALGGFFVCWAGYGLFSVLSTYFAIKLSEDILHNLRLMMSQSILMTSLKTLEEIGKATILSYLSHLFEALRRLLVNLPEAPISIATLLGLYGYMIWLSPILFAVLTMLLIVGIPIYIKPLAIHHKYLQQYTEVQGRLNTFLHALLDGIKELLQHHAKKSAFVNRYLQAISEQARDITLRAHVYGNLMRRWGELYLFSGLAVMLFVLPRYDLVSFKQIGNILLVFLFTLGSIDSVINFWFNLQRVWVEIKQVESLHLRLFGKNLSTSPDENGAFGPPLRHIYLTVEQVSYTYYHSEQDENFTLGPIAFTLKDSQITFVTGGNGSGKSTLAKLLCGLYLPESGRITYNGIEINEQTYAAYRELFSVVFFDFFLFENLLGLEGQDIDEKANLYLKRLRMPQNVSVKNGRYSLLHLSQGQRKRLALLRAYLDDRSIYVFDEWAADQDAAFKAIFYEELLPELKQQGKTIVVITHDESFFHVADQIIKLEDGRQKETSGSHTNTKPLPGRVRGFKN